MFYCPFDSISIIVLDIKTSHYFGKTILQCDFAGKTTSCSCEASQKEFDENFTGIGGVNCLNSVTKNLTLLHASTTLSVMCFLVTSMILMSVVLVQFNFSRSSKNREELCLESRTIHKEPKPDALQALIIQDSRESKIQENEEFLKHSW